MNKLLSKALAKTFALHVLATLVIYAVPFRLNFLVFHLVVLVWLLVTSGRNRSPYFYGITVLMSIMAIGSFMHESFLLPIFYLLLLPYWVQSGRYALRNVYAIPITSLFRLPAMFSRLFNAYKVYLWAASKGSWHHVWTIGWLCVLVILQLALVIWFNNIKASDTIDLYIVKITRWDIGWLPYTLIPVQVLIQLFIRNASTRFDVYYKKRLQPNPKDHQQGGILYELKTNRIIHRLAFIALLVFLLAQVTDLIFLFYLIVTIVFETWITGAIIFAHGLLIILSLIISKEHKYIRKRPKAKEFLALIVAGAIAVHLALPYEHLWLLWLVKSKASPENIIEYIHINGQEDFFFESGGPLSFQFISAFGHDSMDNQWGNPSESSLLSSHERLSIKFNSDEYQGTYLLEQLIIDGLLEHPQRHEMIEGFSSNNANQDE